jgi:integrase/recombinase XerD
VAGEAVMTAAVDAYVALRRVAGFALSNTEYLLHSFARFAHDRHEAHIRTASVMAWASQGPSLAQRPAVRDRAAVCGVRPARRSPT